jgi:hypothetical protein
VGRKGKEEWDGGGLDSGVETETLENQCYLGRVRGIIHPPISCLVTGVWGGTSCFPLASQPKAPFPLASPPPHLRLPKLLHWALARTQASLKW